MELDKQVLLEALQAQVKAKLDELRASYEASRDAVLSTPHVMKSKREVFGQESAYLANALALNIQEREHELKVLKAFRLPATPSRVSLGCVVGLGTDVGRAQAFYFLLPVCGGMELTASTSGPTVHVVTPAAPMTRALLGRSLGDEVTLPTVPPNTVTITVLR
jgi:transcription elongation GreA/GreB family factor